MEMLIEENISDSEIAKLCKAHEEAKNGSDSEKEITARFQYAYGLLKSKHITDIKHGISLMENLYYEGNQSARRDYLYYIAIGQTRLKKYNLALDCLELFLQFEPQNHQAQQLRSFIKEKLTKDGLIGMAITGGAALVVGGLIGVAMSVMKK